MKGKESYYCNLAWNEYFHLQAWGIYSVSADQLVKDPEEAQVVFDALKTAPEGLFDEDLQKIVDEIPSQYGLFIEKVNGSPEVRKVVEETLDQKSGLIKEYNENHRIESTKKL